MTRVPLLTIVFLVVVTVPNAGAQDLDFLLPARYIDVTVGPDVRVSALTGDYPYRLRGGRDQLALYTGLPLYAPVAGSLGSVNQIAYRDDYSISTPLAVLGLGYQAPWKLLASPGGPFAVWGARWGPFSGGASYRPLDGGMGATVGWFSPSGSVSVQVLGPVRSGSGVIRVAVGGGWSLVLSVEGRWGAPWTVRGGVGTYLYEPAADSLAAESWDHVIAHRGSLQRAPENTQPAVELALREAEVELIEVDVQRTADGVFELVHDDFLIRYNGTWDRIADLTAEELRRRDFGRWFSPQFTGTPVLELEGLASLAAGSPTMGWIFDLKNIGTTPEDARALLASVTRTVPPRAPVLVASGDLKLLASLGPLSPYPLGLQVDVARTFFLWGDYFPPLLEAELESMVRQAPVSSFFLFTSKFANRDAVERVAERLGVTYYLWNFHDRIYGRNPPSQRP